MVVNHSLKTAGLESEEGQSEEPCSLHSMPPMAALFGVYIVSTAVASSQISFFLMFLCNHYVLLPPTRSSKSESLGVRSNEEHMGSVDRAWPWTCIHHHGTR